MAELLVKATIFDQITKISQEPAAKFIRKDRLIYWERSSINSVDFLASLGLKFPDDVGFLLTMPRGKGEPGDWMMTFCRNVLGIAVPEPVLARRNTKLIAIRELGQPRLAIDALMPEDHPFRIGT